MSEPPSTDSEDRTGSLQRCIRDLVALNALPSMCVGCNPNEALEIILNALPTALSCELIRVRLPGSPVQEHAVLHGRRLSAEELAEIRVAALASDGRGSVIVPGAAKLQCIEVALPMGSTRGELLIGRRTPLDADTDRVLVRNAANLAGATLETARVLELARHKDEFLAILGHELRNPLAPIMTAVELLARVPAVDRERQVIDRQARHLTRLVDDLLDISRVTRGHVELRSERVSLDSVLERAVEVASPLITRHRHALSVARCEGVAVWGDPVRLAQVFGNLLTNAAKFTPPDGAIEVSIDRTPDRVRVTVRDNGRGIARDQLARIFEPFVQVDRARDALRGGLGLGLAIVDNLVRRHGGAITAHSDGVGRGAAFTVELPTTTAAQEVRSSVAPSSAAPRAGVRVLIVDDNADVAELLSAALELEGFETAIELDGRAALERWRHFVPHAAVLDVGLPELDGYDLARALRAEHGLRPMLIAATGYGQPTDRLRATHAGFDHHFVKPVSVSDIVRVIDRRIIEAQPAL
jgi:signal transduction histidine kinase/CheY-like chemotaxis protein